MNYQILNHGWMFLFTGNAMRLSLQVSGDGMRVLLVVITGQVFLWECTDVRDLMGVRDGMVNGHWAQIQPLEDAILPSSEDKEASQHTIFVKSEVCIHNRSTCLICFAMCQSVAQFYRPAVHFLFIKALYLILSFSKLP